MRVDKYPLILSSDSSNQALLASLETYQQDLHAQALDLLHPQPFPMLSQCIRCPLCCRTQKAYIHVDIPTAPKLPTANQRKSSGLENIAAATQCANSKTDTNDISVPANEDRV